MRERQIGGVGTRIQYLIYKKKSIYTYHVMSEKESKGYDNLFSWKFSFLCQLWKLRCGII